MGVKISELPSGTPSTVSAVPITKDGVTIRASVGQLLAPMLAAMADNLEASNTPALENLLIPTAEAVEGTVVPKHIAGDVLFSTIPNWSAPTETELGVEELYLAGHIGGTAARLVRVDFNTIPTAAVIDGLSVRITEVQPITYAAGNLGEMSGVVLLRGNMDNINHYGSLAYGTVIGNLEVQFSSHQTSESFTFEITNGGAYTVTWPANVRWAGGVAPTLTSSGTDIIEFYTRNGGTTWNGFVAGYDMKVPV